MDLLATVKAYPVVTIIVAIILFIIGFKIAKIVFWILAGVALLVALGMWVF